MSEPYISCRECQMLTPNRCTFCKTALCTYPPCYKHHACEGRKKHDAMVNAIANDRGNEDQRGR